MKIFKAVFLAVILVGTTYQVNDSLNTLNKALSNPAQLNNGAQYAQK